MNIVSILTILGLVLTAMFAYSSYKRKNIYFFIGFILGVFITILNKM